MSYASNVMKAKDLQYFEWSFKCLFFDVKELSVLKAIFMSLIATPYFYFGIEFIVISILFYL